MEDNLQVNPYEIDLEYKKIILKFKIDEALNNNDKETFAKLSKQFDEVCHEINTVIEYAEMYN